MTNKELGDKIEEIMKAKNLLEETILELKLNVELLEELYADKRYRREERSLLGITIIGLVGKLHTTIEKINRENEKEIEENESENQKN